MKYTVVTLIIWLNSFAAFSQNLRQKQISIPLNNQKGVPFAIGEEVKDYYVDGFEVDTKGNFYFLGGNSTISLVAFKGNKQLYRYSYSKNIGIGSHLLFWKDTLYTYNGLVHTIFLLNPTNGRVIKTYKSKDAEDINSFQFLTDGLVTESYNRSPIRYYLYDLKANRTKEVLNKYNLPFTFRISVSSAPWSSSQFLGMWNDKFVFYSRRIDSGNINQGFFTTDHTGKILQVKVTIDYLKKFGSTFAESPTEFRIVRNNSLYVLGRKGKFAVITEVPLESFFSPQ